MRPWFALTLAVSYPALAQEPAAPPAAPAAAAPAEAAAADPLAQARHLVEVEADTKENLKKAIDLYEQNLGNEALPAKVRAAGFIDEARAWYRYGELEKTADAKIAAFEKGRVAAQKAMALDPTNHEGPFWDATNQAVVGRTRGVMNSLFMLGDLRRGLNKSLQLNPKFWPAKMVLAQIDHSVPGFAGGSDERALNAYLEILKAEPNFTAVMCKLAAFYADTGEEEKAREIANQVLTHKNPRYPNDWRKFDRAEAKKVLAKLEE